MNYRFIFGSILLLCLFISSFTLSHNDKPPLQPVNNTKETRSVKPSESNITNGKHISSALTILAAIFGKKMHDFLVIFPEFEDEKSTLKLAFKDKETEQLYFIEDCSAPEGTGFDLTKLPELAAQAERRTGDEEKFLLNAYKSTSRSCYLGEKDEKNRFVECKSDDNAFIEYSVQYALLTESLFRESKLERNKELTSEEKEKFVYYNKPFLRDPGSSFLVTKLVKPVFCNTSKKSLEKNDKAGGEKKGFTNFNLQKTVNLIDPSTMRIESNAIVTSCLRNWTTSGIERFNPVEWVTSEDCINESAENISIADNKERDEINSSCFSGILKSKSFKKIRNKMSSVLICCSGCIDTEG